MAFGKWAKSKSELPRPVVAGPLPFVHVRITADELKRLSPGFVVTDPNGAAAVVERDFISDITINNGMTVWGAQRDDLAQVLSNPNFDKSDDSTFNVPPSVRSAVLGDTIARMDALADKMAALYQPLANLLDNVSPKDMATSGEISKALNKYAEIVREIEDITGRHGKDRKS